MKITTVGIDLVKNLFQVHGIDEHGKAVLKMSTTRSATCLRSCMAILVSTTCCA